MTVYAPLLILTSLAGWFLYGYALRNLTNPAMDARQIPSLVFLALSASPILNLFTIVYVMVQFSNGTANLGPLGGVLLAALFGDLLRFDRLLDPRLKRYGTFVRATAVPWHGIIAFCLGFSVWEVVRQPFSTASASQILVAAVAGAATLAFEALTLPRFVTVQSHAERMRLKRGAWHMALVRTNLFFVCCAVAYVGLLLTPLHLSAETHFIISAAFAFGFGLLISPYVTVWLDTRFLPEEAVPTLDAAPVRTPRSRAKEAAPQTAPIVPHRTGGATAAADPEAKVQIIGNLKGGKYDYESGRIQKRR